MNEAKKTQAERLADAHPDSVERLELDAEFQCAEVLDCPLRMAGVSYEARTFLFSDGSALTVAEEGNDEVILVVSPLHPNRVQAPETLH